MKSEPSGTRLHVRLSQRVCKDDYMLRPTHKGNFLVTLASHTVCTSMGSTQHVVVYAIFCAGQCSLQAVIDPELKEGVRKATSTNTNWRGPSGVIQWMEKQTDDIAIWDLKYLFEHVSSRSPASTISNQISFFNTWLHA